MSLDATNSNNEKLKMKNEKLNYTHENGHMEKCRRTDSPKRTDSRKVQNPKVWTVFKMQSCKRYRDLVKLYPEARKKGYDNEQQVIQPRRSRDIEEQPKCRRSNKPIDLLHPGIQTKSI